MSKFRKVGECLYRYSSGTYYARFKSNGKEIRRSLKTDSLRVARLRLGRYKETQSHVDRTKSKTTITDLCDSMLRTAQHLSKSTLGQKTLIAQRIKCGWPTGRDTEVTRIKPSDVKEWLARYKLGPVARNKHLRAVKQILDSAVADGIIVASPAAGIKPMKLSKPIRKTPTFEQFQAVVDCIRSQKYNGHDANESADFVEFLGLAGLGKAEAAALTFGDIDWQREQIVTFRHKTKSGFAIPLYPQLRPLLEKRHAQRADDGRVFKIHNAKKAIEAACARLNLPAYTHISFRRMFITRAIERGVDVKVIADWQGHCDGGKLILETYSHVNPTHSKRMAALMTAEGQPDNVIPIASAI